ncbi:hypothetical protein GXB81_06750 [Paraburkholderia sp. Ac-20336]|uniref:hypothetical protein n=1 Tax=Burkholderiaceae TaxID=119060 RepID=UPI001422E085|nr:MULTISPECIES: hypothetical protein [Burkholderiaceae]MBN3802756.1 hypothetical protein [Paraburkholderia sp. Ac-20336]MBN3849966.1 hypothetical protein [Paraburkholderia sp. Ac-20342]NIF52016.1 hypothetical protein [Burkholderia sp. Ax-1724]NIF79695.1 hypothetical protein [Paraburkholderia sp. Cy-641]
MITFIKHQGLSDTEYARGKKTKGPLLFCLHLLIAAPLILASASCTENIDTPPIVSATGYLHGQSVSLEREQILALSHWIDAHRTGWKGLMETPPPPSISLDVKYAGGREGSFEIWQDPHGNGGVVYHYIYEHVPEVKRVAPLKQSLSEQDMQAFRAIANSIGK